MASTAMFESNSRYILMAGPERLTPEQVRKMDSKSYALSSVAFELSRGREKAQK